MPHSDFYTLSITQKKYSNRILPLNDGQETINPLFREEFINPLFQEEFKSNITDINIIVNPHSQNIKYKNKKERRICEKQETEAQKNNAQEKEAQETKLEQTDTCIICLDELNETEKLKPCKTCKTYMDKACLVKYLSHRNTNLDCPTCLQRLDIEYIKQHLINENEIQAIIRNIEREIMTIDNVSIDVDVDVDVYLRLGRLKCNRGNFTLVLCICFGLLLIFWVLFLKGR